MWTRVLGRRVHTRAHHPARVSSPTLTLPSTPLPHSPDTLASLRTWADAARTAGTLPSIFLPPRPADAAPADAPAWSDVAASASVPPPPAAPADGRPPAWAGIKQHAPVRAKPGAPGGVAAPGGRTYTSRFRGVHQTFPTRRWEAQFRKGGRPTSLGCFDTEEAAARAYDRMMLWCELHGAAGTKTGVTTNFDPSEYAADVPSLRASSQDDLVLALRAEGRRQAAERSRAAKAAGGGKRRAPRAERQVDGLAAAAAAAAAADSAPPNASTGGSGSE